MRAHTLLSVAVAALLTAAACHQTTVRGPNDEAVTASAPSSLTIHRGDSIPLKVSLDRDNYEGPVTVSISQLPKGVETDPSTQTVDTTSATFSLKASQDAELVANQAVNVTVDAMDGRRATQYVALTVAE
jgi:cytoskeletal protein RodZ